MRRAGSELSERLLRPNNGWLHFAEQVNVLRRVEPLMTEGYREIYKQTLPHLSQQTRSGRIHAKSLIQRRPGSDTITAELLRTEPRPFKSCSGLIFRASRNPVKDPNGTGYSYEGI